ncbi:hypothetical protein GCE9029_02442 [Grimontia celer]|uniref:Uncharacterized protein n=1 Tax=Grimontia celer TaxID=1796497 RepID=A0A128F4G8_9GAMM|nr:carboxypeptidase-like regulatory domain-containing protein [Grimontia celer]CZF81176.1 hypothetical protein GCE9029_02442 [Grimontia celer]
MNGKRTYYYVYMLMFSLFLAACNGSGEGGSSAGSSSTGSLTLALMDETNEYQFQPSGAVSQASYSHTNSSSQNTLSYTETYSTEFTSTSNTTSEPTLDLEADTFLVQGIGPNGESFDIEANSRGAQVIDGLVVGSWQITVIAKDKNGVEFARGQQSVRVQPSETVTSIVELTMEEGNGTLDFEVLWPKDIALSPNSSIGIKDSEGNDVPVLSVEQLEFDDNYWLLKSKLDSSIESGYYSLVFTVHDGSQGNENAHLATGFAETIRIVANEVTTVRKTLEGVKGIGSIDINVELDVKDSLPIEIIKPESYPKAFTFDSATEFTIDANVPSTDSAYGKIIKSWYINGYLVGIGPTFTFDAATSPLPSTYNGKYISGNYRLDVVAFTLTGDRSGSASYDFEVTGSQIALNNAGSLKGRVYYTTGNSYINDYTLTLTGSEGVSNIYDAQSLGARDSGEFNLENIPSGDYTLTITRDGYFPYSKAITIDSSRVYNAEVIRLAYGYVNTVSGTSGGTFISGIDWNNRQATFEFPEDAFELEDGTEYTGSVRVRHTSVTPSDSSFLDTFPGGFTGITTGIDGEPEEVDIISFGVVAATLTTADNRKVVLRNGKKATVSIAVANPETAPATIPLWHLNEEGNWVEEGEAVLIDGKYVGEVSHFSWWNFDYPCGVTDSGRCPWIRADFNVVDTQGNPAPYANIILKGEGNFGFGKSVVTDHLGRITTKLPFSPTATREQWESISYLISAEQNQPNLDAGEILRSEPTSMQFFLDHTEGVAGYGKPYSRTLVLDGSQAYLTVQAQVDRQWRGVEHNGAAVKVRQPENDAANAEVDIKVSNLGEQELTVSDISVVDTDGIPATNWEVSPTSLTGLGFYAHQNFTVTYSGQNWAQEKAKVVLESNDAGGEFHIPLVTVDRSTLFVQDTLEFDTLNTYDGQMGYCLEVIDPYADPYADGNREETPCIHSTWSERYPVFTGTKTRAYFAFDLSTIPQGAVITSAKLVHNSWNYADANIFLGDQSETLTVEDVASRFASPCKTGNDDCLLAVIPARVNGGSSPEGELNQNGLNALNNAVLNGSVLKLLAMNDDLDSFDWNSSLYLDQLKLEVEFAH